MQPRDFKRLIVASVTKLGKEEEVLLGVYPLLYHITDISRQSVLRDLQIKFEADHLEEYEKNELDFLTSSEFLIEERIPKVTFTRQDLTFIKTKDNKKKYRINLNYYNIIDNQTVQNPQTSNLYQLTRDRQVIDTAVVTLVNQQNQELISLQCNLAQLQMLGLANVVYKIIAKAKNPNITDKNLRILQIPSPEKNVLKFQLKNTKTDTDYFIVIEYVAKPNIEHIIL